ncbi:unnamed protein product, partial [Tetraodon nigroviridis]
VDNSSVIEIDFIRSDIFEEVLNYMYTARISVKKKDVNLMMSSGQILGIRFLDKLCSQKRDVSSEDKDKFPYDIVKMALPPEAQLAADAEVRSGPPAVATDRCNAGPKRVFCYTQVLGEHDDSAPTDDLVETSTNQVLDKSPSAALHVQEAILKELANEDVHKVTCYDQDVVTEMEAEPKELGQEHHTTQTLAFADSMGEVKDEQPPSWSTATTDMKFEYLLYGHREQLACQVCGKTFPDESRLAYVHNTRQHTRTAQLLTHSCLHIWGRHNLPTSTSAFTPDHSPDNTPVANVTTHLLTLMMCVSRKHEKLHSAERPFACEVCNKAFTTHAHLKEHLKIHTGFKPYRCDVCGKSFIRAPDLKKHERVHSNERPFACQMCDKAFKHKSHLKDHERRHRGEKPFVCRSCTKAFAKVRDSTSDCVCVCVCVCVTDDLYFQASDLKRHENNMHSERKQLNSLQSDTETLQAAAMR